MQELETMIFAYAVREKIIDKLNANYFENQEIRNYINDFQRLNIVDIQDYIGVGQYSISRLNQLIDDFNIISMEQYNNALLKLEKKHKKKEIIRAVKEDNISIIPGIIESSIIENKDNFDVMIENWLLNEPKENIKTGIELFDEFNGGLVEPEMVTIAARPGRGKTAIAIQMINNFIKNNKSVFFASLEMSKMQIIQRLIVNFSKIENWKVRKKLLTNYEQENIASYIHYMNDKKLRVEDDSNLTIEKIKSKSYCYDIVVIDYIQLLDADKKFKSEFEKLEFIAKEVKKMAKSNKQIVIALAQLNRESERNGITLGSIKGAGAIEQNSDIVIFLNEIKNDVVFSVDVGDYDELICFEVMKYREGKTGKIPLVFRKPIGYFENIKREQFLK